MSSVFCLPLPGSTGYRMSKGKQASEPEPVKIIYQFNSNLQNQNQDPISCCSKKRYPILSCLMWDIKVTEAGAMRVDVCKVEPGTNPYYLSCLAHIAVWINECDCIRQNVCKCKIVINEKYDLFGLNKLFKYVFLEVKCYNVALRWEIDVDKNRLLCSRALFFKCVPKNPKPKKCCFEKRLYVFIYVCECVCVCVFICVVNMFGKQCIQI